MYNIVRFSASLAERTEPGAVSIGSPRVTRSEQGTLFLITRDQRTLCLIIYAVDMGKISSFHSRVERQGLALSIYDRRANELQKKAS